MNGLTPHQKIFVALCKGLDFPTEQIAICLCIFSTQQLKEILDWVADETKRRGRLLEDFDLTRKIAEMVHQGNYVKTDNI